MSIFALRSPTSTKPYGSFIEKVAVLMCAYSGKFFTDWLGSFGRQTHEIGFLVASEYGSQNNTPVSYSRTTAITGGGRRSLQQ